MEGTFGLGGKAKFPWIPWNWPGQVKTKKISTCINVRQEVNQMKLKHNINAICLFSSKDGKDNSTFVIKLAFRNYYYFWLSYPHDSDTIVHLSGFFADILMEWINADTIFNNPPTPSFHYFITVIKGTVMQIWKFHYMLVLILKRKM